MSLVSSYDSTFRSDSVLPILNYYKVPELSLSS
jgi:hypothetical protein